jgi:Ca2+:H+ antiporter
MNKSDMIKLGLAVSITLTAGAMHYIGMPVIVTFIGSAIALALVASVVGMATEQIGGRLGPGATGILQSALGNLPELFICIFALKAGMDEMVKAALIGSILGNSLLVFGLALFVGGIKNGTQYFHSEPPKMMVTLMTLAFAALAIPTLATMFHTNAAAHINALDGFVAVVLLVLFFASIYFFIKRDKAVASPDPDEKEHEAHATWSLTTSIIVLASAGLAAAFVSEWFVDALQPAMIALNINEIFAGLVIVAIAGNSIENFIGIQLAYRNKSDYAVSVILNSSLQIALGVFPILVILSFFLGGAVLSFVLSPMLLAALALTVIVQTIVVFDGESIWLEGLAMIGLYCLIAAAFWWG